MMKAQTVGLYLSISLLLLSSCRKNQPQAVQIMPYEVSWEIPAGLNNFETHFFQFPGIMTNSEEFFNPDNVPLDEIQTVQARQAELLVRDPNLTLEDIRTVEVYLVSPDDPQRELEAFYTLDLQNPNQRERSIRLIPSLTNLKPIYSNESMKVIIRINFWRTSSASVPVRLDMELEAFR